MKDNEHTKRIPMDRVFVTKHGITRYNSKYIVIRNQKWTKVGVLLISDSAETEVTEEFPVGTEVSNRISWDNCWFLSDNDAGISRNQGAWDQEEANDYTRQPDDIFETLKISRMVPANVWYYMYAYTNERNYFIYAHRRKVSFFEKADITDFQDTIIRLESLKYFNEVEGDYLTKLKSINLKEPVDQQIKIGDCLVSPDFRRNFRAEVWVDNLKNEIIMRLKDAGKFSYDFASDIQLQ